MKEIYRAFVLKKIMRNGPYRIAPHALLCGSLVRDARVCVCLEEA